MRTQDTFVVKEMHYLMGCFIEIEVQSESREKAVRAVRDAFSEMKRVEEALSFFSESSITTLLNQEAMYGPVKVPEEVFYLIKECLRYSRLTRGAFDITSGSLSKLWKDAEKRQELPTSEEICARLYSVGSRYIELNEESRTVFFTRPGIMIDFGASGKGYAVDQVVKVLRKYGLKRAIVNAGSNIYHLSDDEDLFGITHPLKLDDILTTVSLKNNSVSTSANYERYFKIGDKRLGHLIDPRSGFPTQNKLLSVSILSESSMIGDILSTAVFILGEGLGRKLLERLQDIDGILVYYEGLTQRMLVNKVEKRSVQ